MLVRVPLATTTDVSPEWDKFRTTNLPWRVNGNEHRRQVNARVTLLDAPREYLGLVGSKKGCDATGRRIRSLPMTPEMLL